MTFEPTNQPIMNYLTVCHILCGVELDFAGGIKTRGTFSFVNRAGENCGFQIHF